MPTAVGFGIFAVHMPLPVFYRWILKFNLKFVSIPRDFDSTAQFRLQAGAVTRVVSACPGIITTGWMNPPIL